VCIYLCNNKIKNNECAKRMCFWFTLFNEIFKNNSFQVKILQYTNTKKNNTPSLSKTPDTKMKNEYKLNINYENYIDKKYFKIYSCFNTLK